jgi:MFS family permease
MVAASIFGGLMFSIYPVAVARTHDMFEPKDVVTVSSALLLFYGIGAVIGPMASAAVIELLDSPHGFFAYFSVVCALSAGVSFFLRQKEIAQIIPVSDQGNFMVMKHTSPVALQIDLRLEDPEAAGEGVVHQTGPVPDHIGQGHIL